MTPKQERAEARKALESATPGPWEVEPTSQHLRLVKSQTEPAWMYVASQVCGDENAHLIANAPTWIRNSLDREEQLMAQVERENKEKHAFRRLENQHRKEKEQLARKVAEQDKEIQRLQRHLENIERKGYV